VKDAKSEAQREIEEYKKQKDEEFKKFEAQVCNPRRGLPALIPYTLLIP